jgi:hypothetical protein
MPDNPLPKPNPIDLMGPLDKPVDVKKLVQQAAEETKLEAQATPPPLNYGPGTELKKLLADLGLNEQGGCGCAVRANQMDNWGVDGCREHREEILGWLREQQEKVGWATKLKAGALAVKTGLAFSLNPFDPAPGLLDEAIRRADLSEYEKKKVELAAQGVLKTAKHKPCGCGS